MTTTTVLIADDDFARLRVLALTLAGPGRTTYEFTDGLAALEAARSRRPDLIILDDRLEGLSGLEVCRQLRADARTCDIPVFMLSGLNTPGDVKELVDHVDALLSAASMSGSAVMNMKSSGPEAFRYQEIVFSLVMGFITLVNHENPLLIYPDILWAFAALLGANLAYQLALTRFKDSSAVALTSMGANIALVSLIVRVSGGCQSSFWPMYLLPIFTACLYLERRHVLLAVASAAAFLAYFYIDGLWNSISWEPSELAIKAGALALAAAVTMPLAFRERDQRRALQAGREKMEALALSLNQKSAADIAHDINNPLTVILGTVDIMLQESIKGSPQHEDLERIQAAARRCARATDSLFDRGGVRRLNRPLVLH